MKRLYRTASLTALFMALAGSGLFTNVSAADDCADLHKTMGFWKTHPADWPVDELTIGGLTYAQAQMLDYLNVEPDGDAFLILMHQTIAAKLNVAYGADAAPVADDLADADYLLEHYPYGTVIDEATRDWMISVSERLDEFNNGGFCKLPVELAAFSAHADGPVVQVTWSTASEDNNLGFAVEHRLGSQGFREIAFVQGRGTTSTRADYAVAFDNLGYGNHAFRLRQVDLDGTAYYSPEVEVNVQLTETFALAEAYPNPFNPSTTIRFSLREAGEVALSVYDLNGRLVATLASGQFAAGSHEVRFQADGLPSGTYLYRLRTPSGPVTGSLMLLK